MVVIGKEGNILKIRFSYLKIHDLIELFYCKQGRADISHACWRYLSLHSGKWKPTFTPDLLNKLKNPTQKINLYLSTFKIK